VFHKIKLTYLLVCYSFLTSVCFAQDLEAKRLPEVEVTAESEVSVSLPDVVGTNIFAGKKTTVFEVEELPPVATNNFRALFHELPGILVSEVPNESFTSFSYRGIGDPHESFNVLLLRDGIPFQADMLGYPAAYYQPPAQQIERFELTRGGGSLLYGSQPGAVLNFITRQPEFNMDLSFRTNQMFGEKRLYSTYTEVTGGDENAAGMGFFHRRQFDGFRSNNSDQMINNAGVKAAFKLPSATVIRMDFDIYNSDAGEPGGLALNPAEGVASFNGDRWQNTLDNDRLRIERYAPTFRLESELSADSRLEAQVFGAQYRRQSRRQDLGTAPAFGGFPTLQSNTIQTQEFTTVGANLKFLQKYKFCDEGEEQNFTGGISLYGVSSPFRTEAGSNPTDDGGELKRLLNRRGAGISLYAENQFNFGDFKLIPGVRVENIYQTIDERINPAVLDEFLKSESQWAHVPLFGLGAGYQLTKKTELFANISQSYKPVAYQDFVPLGPADTISQDLDPADAYTIEAGYRGKVSSSLNFDASVFRTDYNNQFGRVGTALQNVGRSVYQGLEVGTSVGVLSAMAELNGSERAENMSDLRLSMNATFLDASFVAGPQDGKTPQYAPKYLIRPGISYERPNSLKLAFIATLQDNVFGDDGNNAERFIPSFEVFDLLGEVVLADQARINFGINNLFDEKYFSRVRGNGIDPAAPRNIYGGFTILF
jgi:Fe(3+) dicitrate transport protein